jgi:deoxyribonuclease-4
LGNAELLEKSIDSLTKHMLVASSIHATGVIFHCGSRKGLEFDEILLQVTDSITEVLKSTPSDVSLIFENSAGMGSSIGSKFEEIEAIFSKVNNDRLGLCLDTQHCYASGYDITKDEGIDLLINGLKPIGVEKILAVHANDSKVPFDAGVDRHENIGEGFIGIKGFEKIMAVDQLSEVPFLLEVPGFGKVRGPDEENVNRLKKIRLD